MAIATPAHHNRLVPLAGGHNFRDLGGYSTSDGRRIRRGKLFRSGTLSTLTADDAALLAGHGLRVVCDLRAPAERARQPSVPIAGTQCEGWQREIGHGHLRDIVSAPGATPQHVHDALRATYAFMPWNYAEMYRVVFRHLAAGNVPLVFHCAAGKDRTGTLAALILGALSVPDEDVLADYMLTDSCLDLKALAAAPRADGEAGFDFLRALSPEMRAPLLTCHPGFLQAALESVRTRHGSIFRYVDEVLGIAAADMERIRQALLEP